MNLEEFYRQAHIAIEKFDDWVARVGTDAIPDHICFKCSSTAEFEAMRAMFEPTARFVYQSNISKRRIAIIGLADPIYTKLGGICVLELSDQKPDGSQQSGFDHIEIYPRSITMKELAHFLATHGTVFSKHGRPHHTTYDAKIADDFKVRIEKEPILEKIKRDEMT